jgi:uncharacterized protein YbjT (DUF2867 family)
VIGGTGEVGGAVVQALLATPACREVVMVVRKPPLHPPPALAGEDKGGGAPSRVRAVVMDTGAADFQARIADLAREVAASGDRVAAASCVGVGAGSAKWSEEQLKQLEIGVVGGFAKGVRQAGVAQFCLLTAVGSSSTSRIRYARVMGLKEEAVQALAFPRLAIFRPGIIVGNAHTPRAAEWLGKLVPGQWGNIDQRDIGRAFAAEIAVHGTETGVVYYDNRGMRALLGR